VAARQRYRTVSAIAWTARGIGWLLIALAVARMRPVLGSLAISVGLFSSVALALAGIFWLGAVEAAVFLFNRYLSRN